MDPALERARGATFVAHGVGAALAVFAYGVSLLVLSTAIFRVDLGLGGLIYIPFWMGMALAGLALGLWTAWKPGKPAWAGWITTALAAPVLMHFAAFLLLEIPLNVLDWDNDGGLVPWALHLSLAALPFVAVFTVARAIAAKIRKGRPDG